MAELTTHKNKGIYSLCIYILFPEFLGARPSTRISSIHGPSGLREEVRCNDYKKKTGYSRGFKKTHESMYNISFLQGEAVICLQIMFIIMRTTYKLCSFQVKSKFMSLNPYKMATWGTTLNEAR